MIREHIPLFCALVLASLGCGDSSGSGGGGATQSTGGLGGGSASTGGASADGGSGGSGPAAQVFIAPRTGITADEMGVLVNDDDPLSVAIAAYYVEARAIPAANVVHLHIPNITATTISEADFTLLAQQVDDALSADVQALAITWTTPYAVENMSITSAFAIGYLPIGDTCFDPNSLSQNPNPYSVGSDSTSPFTDLGFRPAMTIPATSIEEAMALIDRGVASDDTWPNGAAYMMLTSDQLRSARCVLDPNYGYTNECQILLDHWDVAKSGIGASIVAADSITDKTDVLFYVQGLASVPDLATNTYLPGAAADHLTSYGGQIPVSGQMSAIEFLRAGATGSYGTVVEPCAYQQKFPDPSVLVPRYFAGATLIEAYWKSVVWPAEGIFIGEPLARPFGTGFHAQFADGALVIETTALVPGHSYMIEAADAETGPFEVVAGPLSVDKPERTVITVPDAARPFYRLSE